jgi:hypothetical protein
MLDYRIAIRSYRRAELCAAKTWAMLDRYGVASHATIFLSDYAELDDYRRELGPRPAIVEGAPGCGANGNAAAAWFPPGTRLLVIDDDLSDLLIRTGPQTLEPVGADGWAELVELGFGAAAGGLWGVHPVANAFFHKFSISADLRLISGGFYGQTTRPDRRRELDVTVEEKEDYERSMRWYLADGRVTRLNWYAMKTKAYAGRGGMVEARTVERVAATCADLVARYPGMVELKKPKATRAYPELRLRRRPTSTP